MAGHRRCAEHGQYQRNRQSCHDNPLHLFIPPCHIL
jgi:hypothetical protein